MTEQRTFVTEVKLEPVSATWKWENEQSGLVKWSFSNPNNTPVTFILLRGISVGGAPATEIYAFGDAFYPLYYYDFGVPYQSGTPSPLLTTTPTPPLAMFKNPSGKIISAFIFTLKAKGSYEMTEGGFVGIEPAGISTPFTTYNQTAKFSVNYNVAQSCQQYNKQAGTNYSCPPNPFTVESAMFILPQEVNSIVSGDSISMVGATPAPKPTPAPTPAPTGTCVDQLIKAFEDMNYIELISALECIFGHVDDKTIEKIKTIRRW